MTEALQQTIDGGEIDHWEVVGTRPPVAEGDTCDKCGRRVPHAKKKDSPVTRVSSYRVPIDSAEIHNETLEAWAQHWGLFGRPHWKFQLLLFAAADALAKPPRDIAGDLEGEGR